jgi:hypothetical protein
MSLVRGAINSSLRFARSVFHHLADFYLRIPIHLIRPAARTDDKSSFVVSLTSFPARIGSLWIVVECLLRQTRKPRDIFIYLDEGEFGNQPELPRCLTRRLRRGVSVIWVTGGYRSYNKLVHSYGLMNLPVVTVDDDKYLPRDFLAQIMSFHDSHPRHIVGGRGWKLPGKHIEEGRFGEGWQRATRGEQGRHLFLPGVDGVLYPPGSLDSRVGDMDAATRLCPTNDDIWFWAAARAAQASLICAGTPVLRSIPAVSAAPKLNQVNSSSVSTEQLGNAVDFFQIGVG